MRSKVWLTLVFVGVVGSLDVPYAFAAATTDRAEAESILSALEADAEAAKVASAEIDKAKQAMARANEARNVRNSQHVEHFEKLARVWAETARDVVKANKLEAEVIALQQKAVDGKATAEKDRVLLEETLSRRGRAEVELKRVEADAAQRQQEALDREKKKKGPKQPAAKQGEQPAPKAAPAPKAPTKQAPAAGSKKP